MLRDIFFKHKLIYLEMHLQTSETFVKFHSSMKKQISVKHKNKNGMNIPLLFVLRNLDKVKVVFLFVDSICMVSI